MKKHGFAMVFSLILILCLIGAVSASEDSSACDVETSQCPSQDCAQIEITEDYASYGSQNTVSLSCDESSHADVGTAASISDYSSKISLNGVGEDSYDNNVGEHVSVSCDGLSFSDNQDTLSVSSHGELPADNLGQPISYNPDLNLDYADGDNQLGYDISNVFGSLLDLNSAGGDFEVPVDLSKIDELTIENVFNEIISSSNGYVNNGLDNLLELSSIKTGLINIKFIKNANQLAISLYNTDKRMIYDIDQEISASLWDYITDSLSNGIIVQDTALGSYCCSEQDSEVETSVLTHYPTEFDLPLENTASYVLGVPRDSDADAFIWSIDNTSGKRACIGVALVNESTNGLLNSSLADVALQSQSAVDLKGLSSADLKQIGIDATNKALAYFKSIGIDIKKGYPKLYVLTSAGYVKIKGTSTESVLDGISEVLGSKKNIFPIHTPLWKDLVFYYLWVNNANNKDIASYALEYDETTGFFKSKKRGR